MVREKMMKREILQKIFLLVLFFSCLQGVMGVNSYEQGNFSLKVPCVDENDNYCGGETVCLLTVLDESKEVVVDNENMSFHDQYFSYDLDESIVVGEYYYNVLCYSDEGGAGFISDEFSVRSGNEGVLAFGYCANDNREFFLIGLFTVILIFLTVIGLSLVKIGIFDVFVSFGWIVLGVFLSPCNWIFSSVVFMFAVGLVVFAVLEGN